MVVTRQRIANPWLILAVAALTLVLDQWSKTWVVDNLASPAHPLVVVADGARSVAALLADRGVDGAELDGMIGRRHIWSFARSTGLTAADRVGAPGAPRQLLALQNTGFPAPRRLRAFAADEGGTLGELISVTWRVDTQDVQALLDNDVYQASNIVTDAAQVPAKGIPIAVLAREINCIDGFMKLVYAENPGAAWGFMRDASPSLRKGFFSIIALLASIGMIWAIFTGWMGSALGTWALGPVLGGALGNLVDRNLYNIVVDFVLNYVGEHRWPVYNVADIGITVGVALILIEVFVSRDRTTATDTPATESAAV